LDHIGIERTAIAGHSMGGYVALAFARNYPQRVSGLALVSSRLPQYHLTGKMAAIKLLRMWLKEA